MTSDNATPGPEDKGGLTSEPGAHDTNAGAGENASDIGPTLEKLTQTLADIDKRVQGLDGRTRRQIDELRRDLPKSPAEPKPTGEGETKHAPNSEIATLRKQLEELQSQAKAERTRAALADVFASDDVRSTYQDGAIDIVRRLFAPQVSLNSEGVPVIDDGQTQTPLADAVKAYAQDKPFLRRPTKTQGTGGAASQSMGTRNQAGEIDWTKATPEQFAARQREILGGDR